MKKFISVDELQGFEQHWKYHKNRKTLSSKTLSSKTFKTSQKHSKWNHFHFLNLILFSKNLHRNFQQLQWNSIRRNSRCFMAFLNKLFIISYIICLYNSIAVYSSRIFSLSNNFRVAEHREQQKRSLHKSQPAAIRRL